MIGTLTKKLLNSILPSSATKEHFEDGEKKNKFDLKTFLILLLTWVIVMAISLFIIKLLWNKFLVPAIAIVNPIKSYFQMFGLIMLLQLL